MLLEERSHLFIDELRCKIHFRVLREEIEEQRFIGGFVCFLLFLYFPFFLTLLFLLLHFLRKSLLHTLHIDFRFRLLHKRDRECQRSERSEFYTRRDNRLHALRLNLLHRLGEEDVHRLFVNAFKRKILTKKRDGGITGTESRKFEVCPKSFHRSFLSLLRAFISKHRSDLGP